jgi:hypothetical protein
MRSSLLLFLLTTITLQRLSVFSVVALAPNLSPQNGAQQLPHHPRQGRRAFLAAGTTVCTAAAVAATTVFGHPPSALAIPMVTTDEFSTILRDSSRSVQVVEFAGPSSEQVTVRLVDGTAFGISDVIESPTDPRSPLKIAAYCNAYKVPTKFVNIEAMLASAPNKKTKVYANARVQEAAVKEKARQLRIQADEELRQVELAAMQQPQSR